MIFNIEKLIPYQFSNLYRDYYTSLKNLRIKHIPTRKHNEVKNLFIILLPFKFDKCAPTKPPRKEPKSKTIKILKGNVPIRLKAIAPDAFQKIPTDKKVILMAFKKSIPKVFIKRIVTNKPVPEDIEPFNIPITKTNIINLIQDVKLIFLFIVAKPKSGFVKE